MGEPWLSIIGIGEDGLEGLTLASRAALDGAEAVFGGARHLALAEVGVRGRQWGLPFSTAPVLALRGRRVAVLASGDPFWFGVGGTLSGHLTPAEWRVFPGVSAFSMVAARLGWRLEEAVCLGLHAAPLGQLRAVVGRGQRCICLLRDGAAVGELARWLASNGFGKTLVEVFEGLGGGAANRWAFVAEGSDNRAVSRLVTVAFEGVGRGMSRGGGLPDEMFEHDGQITKRGVRALTVSALAPRAGEVMWDVGAGSGSVGIEVLLAAPGTVVHGVEADAGRAARVRRNAGHFGVDHRYFVTERRAPDGLAGLPVPDVVFVGGGASGEVLAAVWDRLPEGGRLVVNAVTLETEAVLVEWHGARGGALLRIDLAEAGALGSRRGWVAQRPVVQWSVVK